MGEARNSQVNVDNINNYIQQMKIKKTINGFDRVDVYNKMKDFQDMFQAHIKAYEKIVEENEATISSLSYQVETEDIERKKYMKREQELKVQMEQIKQNLLRIQGTVTDLKNRLHDEKKAHLKLEEKLEKERKLLQEYRNREKEAKTEKETGRRVKNSIHLSIVQEKIDAELALLKFLKDYNTEKEKNQIRQDHMQAAGNEMLGCLKRLEESIEYLFQ